MMKRKNSPVVVTELGFGEKKSKHDEDTTSETKKERDDKEKCIPA
jgi:hypothetical protein